MMPGFGYFCYYFPVNVFGLAGEGIDIPEFDRCNLESKMRKWNNNLIIKKNRIRRLKNEKKTVVDGNTGSGSLYRFPGGMRTGNLKRLWFRRRTI